MGSLWNRSGTIERYGSNDAKAAGAKAYFFEGGTTTPLTVFQDSGESGAHTHPLTADANGRWPDVFIPYIESYDVQTTTSDGTQITYSIEIPNPDPIDLSVTIPADEKVQTGMIHAELIDGTRTGYVRLNGRTIGNASSSATERANADTSDLFAYLWNALGDTIAAVSGGRGASAAADFAANKRITLPDLRGKMLVGLDTMGNSAASAFGSLAFGVGDAVTPGSTVGSISTTLIEANLPAHTHVATTNSTGAHDHGGATGTESATHTHSGTTSTGSADHQHTEGSPGLNNHALQAGASNYSLCNSISSLNTGAAGANHTHTITTGTESATHTHSIASAGAHSHTVTVNNTGSGTAFQRMSPARTVTWYIKL